MIYVLIRIIAIIFFIYVLGLIVKEKLKIKYCVLWLGYSLILILISFNVNFIEFISNELNIYYAPSTIFLIGLIFLMVYILHLSIVITKQDKYIVDLVQEVSLLKQRVLKNEENIDEKFDRKK